MRSMMGFPSAAGFLSRNLMPVRGCMRRRRMDDVFVGVCVFARSCGFSSGYDSSPSIEEVYKRFRLEAVVAASEGERTVL